MIEQKDTLYYDLCKFYWLYSSKKDYLAESNFIESVIKKHAPTIRKILDIGCGQGDHINELSKVGYITFGIDKSEEQIKQGKIRFPHLNLVCGDILKDFCLDSCECLIMLWNTILYFSPPENLIKVFKKVNKLLTPGGLIIFDFRSFFNHIVTKNFQSILRRTIKNEGKTLVLDTQNEINPSRGVLIEKTKSVIYDSSNNIISEKEHNKVELNVLSLADIRILLELTGFKIIEILDANALYQNNLQLTAKENSLGYTIIAERI